MSNSLSVALITLNEAANLPRTLKSITWAQEVVIVDSGSTDATREIAEAGGARFFAEPWKGFGRQKNSAIARATGEWVLSLDADEEVSAALAGAYRIPRLNHFLGRPLRHGGYWPDPKLRLFRKGAAEFEESAVHESMRATVPVGQLKRPLIHHCYPTLADYIEHMNRYSGLAAAKLAADGRAGLGTAAFTWNALLNPAATFAWNYLFRLGFLDGREGFLQHLNHSVYILWKYAKAWEAARREKQEITSSRSDPE
jgi:glycosyltransferase involved in cell wall biosynthesis